MKIAIKEVEFSFNNIVFYQTNRVAMGSLLDPKLSNILIRYIEHKVIPKFITKYPNTRCQRYVDDYFVITTNKEENSILFEELNKTHNSI